MVLKFLAVLPPLETISPHSLHSANLLSSAALKYSHTGDFQTDPNRFGVAESLTLMSVDNTAVELETPEVELETPDSAPELDDDTDKGVGVSGEDSFEVEAILTLEKHSENSNNNRNNKENRITWPAH